MKHKIIRCMALLSLPIFFLLIGYPLFSSASGPALKLLNVAAGLIKLEKTPNISPKLDSIYNPNYEDTSSKVENYEAFDEEALVAQANNIENDIDDSDRTIEQEIEMKLPELVDVNTLQFPELGTHYAMLSCDRIALEVPIYWGDTKQILKSGVGQYIGSFLPGFERSILISGHNTTYFKPLQYIQADDVLQCKTNYGQFEYVVTEVSVMTVKDATAALGGMLSSQKEKMILYTCYPFEPSFELKEMRLFVFADKVSGPKVK